MKIDKRPDGTFEEKCGVNLADPSVNVGQVFGNTAMNYQYTLCEESCIELFYSFEGDNYKHSRENFIEVGNKIFSNFENAIAGKSSSLSFISDYKN